MSAPDTTPNRRNLLHCYNSLYSWEKECGLTYYPTQGLRITNTARPFSWCTPYAAIAAFAVLSPNNHELTNHIALEQCLRIQNGDIPPSSKVPAYGKNKAKALEILRYRRESEVSHLVTGQKVRAFYFNTIDPRSSTHITVDGHMHSVWAGRRLSLKREAAVSKTKYQLISDDIRWCAGLVGVTATAFQASLWIGWRRMIAAPNQPWLELW